MATSRLGITRKALASTVAAMAMLTITLMLGISGTAGASVAFDDSFSVYTTSGGCGAVDFVDYGPGAPGGGNNDDYLVIHDYCSDGLGVEVWAFRNGAYLGEKYNSNGLAGAPVIFDPYTVASGTNIRAGDYIYVEVCLRNGLNDPVPSNCNNHGHYSVDG